MKSNVGEIQIQPARYLGIVSGIVGTSIPQSTYLPVGSTVGEGLFAIDARSIPKRALVSLYRVAYTLNDCGRLQPSYATPRYCLE